jgi:AhpD family alkylhydroperoxidase
MGERVRIGREAPDAYRAMAAFDRVIRLDPGLRELVKIRASQLNGCAYCIDMHTRHAREAGESEARLYALAAWRESPRGRGSGSELRGRTTSRSHLTAPPASEDASYPRTTAGLLPRPLPTRSRASQLTSVPPACSAAAT